MAQAPKYIHNGKAQGLRVWAIDLDCSMGGIQSQMRRWLSSGDAKTDQEAFDLAHEYFEARKLWNNQGVWRSSKL